MGLLSAWWRKEIGNLVKAILKNTRWGRISAIFAKDFLIMLDNYCQRIHSDQTHRIEFNKCYFIHGKPQYYDRDKFILSTQFTLILYRSVWIHIQRSRDLSVKFKEMFYLSRSVNCHVYTCLNILISVIVFNLYPAIVKNVVNSLQQKQMAIGL